MFSTVSVIFRETSKQQCGIKFGLFFFPFFVLKKAENFNKDLSKSALEKKIYMHCYFWAAKTFRQRSARINSKKEINILKYKIDRIALCKNDIQCFKKHWTSEKEKNSILKTLSQYKKDAFHWILFYDNKTMGL